MAADAYPRLADLIGGWFHQDYDIEGDTIPEIMGSFLAVTPADQREDLRQEISRFLSEHAEQLDEDFEAVFQPDVVPAALSGSTLNFLYEIRALLEK